MGIKRGRSEEVRWSEMGWRGEVSHRISQSDKQDAHRKQYNRPLGQMGKLITPALYSSEGSKKEECVCVLVCVSWVIQSFYVSLSPLSPPSSYFTKLPLLWSVISDSQSERKFGPDLSLSLSLLQPHTRPWRSGPSRCDSPWHFASLHR